MIEIAFIGESCAPTHSMKFSQPVSRVYGRYPCRYLLVGASCDLSDVPGRHVKFCVARLTFSGFQVRCLFRM